MELVSVIIPAKNRPEMLKAAVRSVVAQTYRPIEIIIVLTGATEATKLSAQELSASHELRILETKPLNLAATRNAGLAIAKGNWVAFLDDDDLWLPEKIAAQMDTASRTAADVVTTNWLRFGEGMADELWMPPGQSPLPQGLDYRQALLLNNYVSVGALVRASVIRSLGGFDAKLAACEDWDMWRRVSLDHKIAHIDQILMKVRIHGQNMSKKKWLMHRTALKHLIKMHRDSPPDLRPLLSRARRDFAVSAFWTAYEQLNEASGNRLFLTLRAVKRSLRSA